jgi:hypothetical protein
MIRRLLILALGLFALVAAPTEAGAWTKFKNNTSVTLWTAHAFASTSGFLCGWDDGCSGSGKSDWRVQGWWQIAPGGLVTVHGSGYGNAYHDAYAEDDFGHTWGGGGNDYATPNNAFDHCGGIGIVQGGTAVPMPVFARVRNTRCCGGSCTSNGTVNFNP